MQDGGGDVGDGDDTCVVAAYFVASYTYYASSAIKSRDYVVCRCIVSELFFSCCFVHFHHNKTELHYSFSYCVNHQFIHLQQRRQQSDVTGDRGHGRGHPLFDKMRIEF